MACPQRLPRGYLNFKEERKLEYPLNKYARDEIIKRFQFK